MLHIFLLILKIIGWILLAVLCFIVLLFCIVLFTPLHYRISAECSGEISDLQADAVFSFFLRLIRGTVHYEDGKLSWKVRLAWKQIGSETTQKVAERHSDAAENTETTVQRQKELPGKSADPETQKKLSEKNAKAKDSQESSTERPNASKKADDSKRDFNTETQTKASLKRDKAEKKEKPPNKKNLLDTIRCTFDKIYANIMSLIHKKDILMVFLTDPAHQAAWRKLLQELKKMLRRLLPTRLYADIHYGFEDPSITGYVLAAISILYPAVADSVEIRPDFHQKVIEGDIRVSGKLRLNTFTAMGLGLLADKNIRKTIIDIKNFNFHEGGEK